MNFNSIAFLAFFLVVSIIFYLIPTRKWQNIFLLVASYYFYVNWEPIFGLLLLATSAITYFGALWLQKTEEVKKKRCRLTFILCLIFAPLVFFKYHNFINESLFSLLDSFGLRWPIPKLSLLLPLGISFYTFMAAGYMIEVFRGKIKAERSPIDFGLFLAFFPQIASGPIGRAPALLPQYKTCHKLNYDNVSEGFKKMLWGFFMKLCIADVLSTYVDAVFNNIQYHHTPTLILTSVFFSIQIYCDFAGYSLIAIGAAKILGFDLMENFRQPYLSMNVKEFWKRWHISLSSWFSDYLYIPLGGNRVKYFRHLLNLMIVFLVSGLWHGAAWTFIIWGALHGTFIIIGNIYRKYIHHPAKEPSSFNRLISTCFCFILCSFAWIFFRATSFQHAIQFIKAIFTNNGSLFVYKTVFFTSFISIFILIFKEMKDHFGWNINFLHSKKSFVSITSAIVLTIFILFFGNLGSSNFIYFKF